MRKQDRFRDQSKIAVERTANGWMVRREPGIYYDRDSERIGSGSKYGERSYNQRPVHAEPINESRGSTDRTIPSDAGKTIDS